MSISNYPENRTQWIRFYNSEEDWNLQNTVPIKLRDSDGSISSVWIFKDYILYVPEVPMHLEDMKTSIKHFVLKRENKFQKMNREIERFERFERFEKLKPVYREQIPEEVRMYVWRRDQGKCVQCGSNRSLEFDHIIPVSEGGSSTERNIQLLCALCNKRKSNKV